MDVISELTTVGSASLPTSRATGVSVIRLYSETPLFIIRLFFCFKRKAGKTPSIQGNYTAGVSKKQSAIRKKTGADFLNNMEEKAYTTFEVSRVFRLIRFICRKAVVCIVLVALAISLKQALPSIGKTVGGWISGSRENRVSQAVSNVLETLQNGDGLKNAMEVFRESIASPD